MSGQHTQGRLLAATNYAQPELRDEAGNLVAVVAAYQPQDALRMAAAWNACQGIPTATLEAVCTDRQFWPLHLEGSTRKGLIALLGIQNFTVQELKRQAESETRAKLKEQRNHFAQLAKDNGSVIVRTACDLGAMTAQRDQLLATLQAIKAAAGSPERVYQLATAALAKHQPTAGQQPA